MRSVSIIGVGRVGGALAIGLSRAGFVIDRLVHRDGAIAHSVSKLLPTSVELIPFSPVPPRIDSDVVLITTSDPDIVGVAQSLVGRLADRAVVMHTSGSLSSAAISSLSDVGHSTGSMHPLASISDPVSGADNFADAFFCIEGDDAAVQASKSIVEALRGRPFSIDTEKKPLYHASAVMACGHLVALIDIAIEMLTKCGIESTHAKEILLPLIASTVNNLKVQSPQEALTGSFARLDTESIARHLAAIEGMGEMVKKAYVLLGERSLDLAISNGGNAADAQKARDLISIAKRNSG